MLKRGVGYLYELRGIYYREKMRVKREYIPGSNIVKLEPHNYYNWTKTVSNAIDCLQRGGVIAVPTDTLYGLCTLVQHADQLYRLKKRPDEKPLGIFVNNAEDISSLAQQTVSTGLLKCLFPGPVTVIFNRSSGVPEQFNPGNPSVGFRIPQVRFVRDLCRQIPYEMIAQTSANLSGTDRNPICIEDFKELWPEIDMIFDAGTIVEHSGSRLGSTVVDLSLPGQYRLLRAGCAEIETIQVLREFGLKSVDELEAERLESAEDKEKRQIEAGSRQPKEQLDNKNAVQREMVTEG